MTTEKKRQKKSGPQKEDDPYCEFKDDRQRLIALIARNVCDVAIFFVKTVGVVAIVYLLTKSGGANAVLQGVVAAAMKFR